MGKNKKKAPSGMPDATPAVSGDEPANGRADEGEGINGVQEHVDGPVDEPAKDEGIVEAVSHGTEPADPTAPSSTIPDEPDISKPSTADPDKPDADETIPTVPDAEDDASDASSISSTDDSRLARLEQDLESTRAEKDHLATQYRSLLGKLTTMRQSLGDRLREDAEELDRRESQIAQLTNELTAAQSSVVELRTELENSSAECAQLGAQVTQLRQASTTQSSDVLSLTRDLRELRGQLELVRLEREEWEAEASRERERREAMEDELRSGERQRRDDEVRRRRAEEVAEREKTRADNLQEVLAEFQSAKDLEIQQATYELENQLRQAVQSLAEWKTRAADAESKMTSLSSDVSKTSMLEREIKEKNAQIGRLRHEAVMTQEHLTEALRRLRRNTSDVNVDRRLVTNVLLQFIATPRADPKRFEMLSLLATILSWEDSERERAGLQRAGGGVTPRKGAGAAAGTGKRKESDVEKTRTQEEQDTFNESFSDLFVEFLLKEAAQGQKKPSSTPPAHTSPQLGGTSSPSGAHASSALFGRQRTHSSASLASNVSGSFPPRPTYTTTTSQGNHLNLNLGGGGMRSPPYMNSLGQRMHQGSSPGQNGAAASSSSPGMSPRSVSGALWQGQS